MNDENRIAIARIAADLTTLIVENKAMVANQVNNKTYLEIFDVVNAHLVKSILNPESLQE